MKKHLMAVLTLLLALCLLLASCASMAMPDHPYQEVESIDVDYDNPWDDEFDMMLESWLWGDAIPDLDGIVTLPNNGGWENPDFELIGTEGLTGGLIETMSGQLPNPLEPPEDILDVLPNLTYGGKIFNIALPNEEEHGYQFGTVIEYEGEARTEAIYRWRNKIEETYDVSIQYKATWDNDYYTDVNASIASGLGAYHLCGSEAYLAGNFVMNELFQDWNRLGEIINENGTPYLNLGANRWDRVTNEASTVNGKLLTLTGDLGVSKLESASVMMINPQLLSGTNLEKIYSLVKDNKWDYEVFKNLALLIYKDNGELGKTADDFFGFMSTSNITTDFWFPSFGLSLVSELPDGSLLPTFDNGVNVSVIEELRGLYEYGSIYMGGPDDADPFSKFCEGALAFCVAPLKDAVHITEETGIVPTPMWDDTNGMGYRTALDDRYTMWGLPTDLPEYERTFTAHIIDALCAESSQTLYYEWYDILLGGRYSSEPFLAAMVDLAMENVSFDLTRQFSSYLGVEDTMYADLPRMLIMDSNLDIYETYYKIQSDLEEQLTVLYSHYH